MHLRYQVINTFTLGPAPCRGRRGSLSLRVEPYVFPRLCEVALGLGVYMFLCALTVSLLLSREHDRAHSGVLQQPTGLARVGGASAEADEGHVCEQPHHQAPLGAIAHSKALTVMACAGAVSGYRSSQPLPPASVGVITEQTAPDTLCLLSILVML